MHEKTPKCTDMMNNYPLTNVFSYCVQGNTYTCRKWSQTIFFGWFNFLLRFQFCSYHTYTVAQWQPLL